MVTVIMPTFWDWGEGSTSSRKSNAQSDASPRAPLRGICLGLYMVFITNVHYLRVLVPSEVQKEHLEGKVDPAVC